MRQTYRLAGGAVLAAGLLLISLLAGCSKATETNADNRKLVLTATTGMIADALRNLGDTLVEVHALMGPGVDPHLYKATQSDLGRLTNANAVFYNGLHLEGKMGDVLSKLARSKPVIAVGEAEALKTQLRETAAFGGAHDPHIWFDVALWRRTVDEMGAHLAILDSANASTYAEHTVAYVNRLDSLDRWVRAQIASIPKEQRVLITAHDAFGYFGRAYGIEVRGLQGISTVAESGLRDVNELVDFIVKRKIKAIFIESSVPAKAIEAVVEGCAARGHQVRIGGTLFSDAMGADGTPEGSYIGMVTANVNTIVGALK